MDDYQQKLEDLIKPIRTKPQVTSGKQVLKGAYTPLMREQTDLKTAAGLAREAQIVAALEAQYPTDKEFSALTGMSHGSMLRNWAVGGRGTLTSCNSFAGRCSAAMGSKISISAFELEKLLRTHGKGHAYVPAASGRRPAYGDIFKAKSFHMGVSLGFEGDTWVTAEGGQGGPISGYDVVKIKRQKWDPAAVEGWCDMGVFLGAHAPTPGWLVGAWTVSCGNTRASYAFDEAGNAFHFTVAVLGSWRGAVPFDTGTIQFQGGDTFSVRWKSKGATEQFTYDRFNSFPGLNERMKGRSTRGEAMSAVRL